MTMDGLKTFLSAAFRLESAAQDVINGHDGALAELMAALQEFGATDAAMKVHGDNAAAKAASVDMRAPNDRAARRRPAVRAVK
jgi:hypothetical protein